MKEIPGLSALDVAVSGLILPEDAEVFLHW